MAILTLSSALVVVIFLVGFFLSKALFKPDTYHPWGEGDGEEVFFPSGRNTLQGRLFNKSGEKGTIVFSHGMGLSSSYYRPEIMHFAAMGYRVFVFEYRGYGKSSGLFLSFRNAVKDTVSSALFVYDQKMPLFLIGHSMGGYSSLSALDELKDKVKGVCVYAPFRSPFSAMHVCASKMGWKGLVAELFIYPFQVLSSPFKANKSLIGTINRTKTPILVIQGEKDQEVSLDGCSILKKVNKIKSPYLSIQIVKEEESNGHISVVRKKGTGNVNEDTMKYIDSFLTKME